MAPPQPSSIPNYPPPPFFNRNRRLFLATLTLTPIGAYVYLRSQHNDNKSDILRAEEEGRRAWLQRGRGGDSNGGGGVGGEEEKLGVDARNFAVRVGRSGGGV
ncbi:hypothetical protein EPUS_08171 [Endocarpon pusillum Z07020]|uniref:Uncharacterized protein n=1 Tax=Endocarpon pusillum (strain Z07020 / HMAS-L-300199) TaxID=1263415 RepID=U1FVS4_ENDPU|nr:uncharacterized protein EPUS_08171 [Endocarpon pusillum Z07020]ERF68937.1 hypothetical protein EPUS_08171 [Endocarpon pusillum Z07020]